MNTAHKIKKQLYFSITLLSKRNAENYTKQTWLHDFIRRQTRWKTHQVKKQNFGSCPDGPSVYSILVHLRM